MVRKLYLDTNVYLDYWFDRKDNLRPLGEFAFQVMKRAVSCEFVIVYSIFVVNELCDILGMTKTECYDNIFKELGDKRKLIYITPEKGSKEEAERLMKRFNLSRNDAMHLAIAKDAGTVLVSRDRHHQELKGKYDIHLPEEL